MGGTSPVTTPGDDPIAEYRAEIARQQRHIYELAAEVRLHPAHLGQVLRGRRALTPDLARRLDDALHGEQVRRDQ